MHKHIPSRVKIVEVGPRDGLQNEARPISVETKLTLIELLADAGLQVIESASFVSPKWVPQMAGSGEVMQRIPRRPGVSYPALVPNLKGLELAIAAGVDEIAVFAAASESFSQQNINCSISDSLDRYRETVRRALDSGLRVRGYVSCVLGCPYEGSVAPRAVAEVARSLLDMGCYEISLGDTIGTGTPLKTRDMLEACLEQIPRDALAVHCHDTYGQACANILMALELGIATIDSSVAGLGGCPYAKGAAGNVGTEDVLYMLDGMGIATGIDMDKLLLATQFICHELGREPASRSGRALLARAAGKIA